MFVWIVILCLRGRERELRFRLWYYSSCFTCLVLIISPPFQFAVRSVKYCGINNCRVKIHDIREALLPISSAAHTHNNKDVLDTITEQYMRDEAAFHAQTADALHSLSTGLSEVSALSHSHANKSVLDSITQEMLDGIASAARQAHSHHNLATLNGITDSHVSRWEDAYTAAMNLNERVGVNEGVFERFKTEILYDMQGCRTSISDILTRLSSVETELSGVENALAAIVEVTT